MKKSLFNIQSEYLRALEELENYCYENQTDEVPDEINERLVVNQDEFSDKLENYWYVLTELNGNLETVKNHIKEMTAKKKAIENNIKRLKNYVGTALEMYGEQNKTGNHFFKHVLFKVTASRSNKLYIIDKDLVPAEYKKTETVTTTTVLTKELKAALKDGSIDGAAIDDSTINVSFR
jgi:predicted nuclease with TOPRIM domain